MNSRTRQGIAWLLVCSFALLNASCGSDPLTADEIRDMIVHNRSDEAIASLRTLLDENPRQPELQLLYGEALLRRGDTQLAVWPLREAIKSEEYAVYAGTQLAWSLFTSRSLDDAVVAATTVLEIEPDNLSALNTRSLGLIDLKREEEAIEDAERMIELDPESLQPRMIRLRALMQLGESAVVETEEALADVRTRLAKGEHPASMRARHCVLEVTYLRDLGRVEEVEPALTACLDAFPASSAVLSEVFTHHESQGQVELAIEPFRKALEIAPEDVPIRTRLARILLAAGDEEGAEAVLLEAVEAKADTDKRVPDDIWLGLYDYYWRTERWGDALAAFEHTIEGAGDGLPTTLRIQHIDLLIQAGELDRADAEAERLEGGFRDLMRGRILMARDRPAEALVLLQEGIRQWPSNATARWLAGQCEVRVGNLEGALEQYVEGWRIEEATKQKERSDVALRVARLLIARGAYSNAFDYALNHATHFPKNPEALDSLVRLLGLADQPEMAEEFQKRLADLPGYAPRTAVLRAKIAEARGLEAGVAVLESAGLDMTDPENAEVLDAWMRFKATAGEIETAIERLDSILSERPDVAAFHSIRARALETRGDDRPSIKAEVDRALALDPDDYRALMLEARLRTAGGEVDAAIAAYDHAAEQAEFPAVPLLGAAELLAMAPDRTDEAIARTQQILKEQPYSSTAATLLARLLLTQGTDLDLALSWANSASRFGGGMNGALVLADVLIARGEPGAAIASLEAFATAKHVSPEVDFRIGMARRAVGDHAGARAALERAISKPGFAERETARRILAGLAERPEEGPL